MNQNLVNETWDRVWIRLRETSIQVSLAVTGGGSRALGQCFGRPGASQHFVDAAVPYSHESLVSFLGGHRPDIYVSEDVARRMAIAAQTRTIRWRLDPAMDPFRRQPLSDSKRPHRPAVGVALTAAMPTGLPDSQPAIHRTPSPSIPRASTPSHSTPPHFWWAVASDAKVAAWHQSVPASWDRDEGESFAQIAVAAGIAWAIDPGFGSEIRAKFPLQSE